MKRLRLRPKSTVPTPTPPSDWDDDQVTCPNCNAVIYGGGGKCCDVEKVRTSAAFAATMPANEVRI